jgi:AraC family transcriptional regulator of adaptative response / DNA-3-methyladenine glycosylase II
MARRRRSISAVVTTGIYCRAGCPASPKDSNVRRYPSQVAAEAAGFRPCLRCRPDRLPPAYASELAPDALRRALVLVVEGALDETTEDDLGRRVGLSGRQLRRLFLRHVGATPAHVARSRRAHFARRLLDESDLSVTEITFAAGFASVRQMNRVMRETFRFPPSELRAKRRERDRLVADGGLPLRTPYDAPFAFDEQLRFLAARAVAGVECVDAGPRYRRTISTCGHPGAIEVSDAGDGRHLLVLAHLPTYNALIDDIARVRRIFGLDATPAERVVTLVEDPVVGPLVAARPGLRLAGAWDRFEMAVRIVVSQQISLRGARTILGRLVERFGERVPGIGVLGLTHLFPTAARLAEAKEAQLAALGMPAARAATTRRLARAYAGGEVTLEPSLPLDELVGRLTELPGIGAWTAECIALRAAGHQNAFPAGDLGLRRAMGLRLGRNGSGPPPAEELRARAEAWRPHRGLAAMHLWASL